MENPFATTLLQSVISALFRPRIIDNGNGHIHYERSLGAEILSTFAVSAEGKALLAELYRQVLDNPGLALMFKQAIEEHTLDTLKFEALKAAADVDWKGNLEYTLKNVIQQEAVRIAKEVIPQDPAIQQSIRDAITSTQYTLDIRIGVDVKN